MGQESPLKGLPKLKMLQHAWSQEVDDDRLAKQPQKSVIPPSTDLERLGRGTPRVFDLDCFCRTHRCPVSPLVLRNMAQ